MSFPNHIRVTGLSFFLQGWNNVYYKTGETSDGCPVYRLDSYKLYWGIPIIGVKIFRDEGVWKLQRECDSYPMSIKKFGQSPQGDPFGYWSEGAHVVPVY